jgi:hypothetical protein
MKTLPENDLIQLKPGARAKATADVLCPSACGAPLGRFSKEARGIFEKTCAKRGIKIYRYANVGNHFHVVLRLGKLWQWKPFIRELASRLAALVDGRAGFWTGRPFTRILHGWGRNFHTAISYVALNQMEAAGLLTRGEVRAYEASG